MNGDEPANNKETQTGLVVAAKGLNNLSISKKNRAKKKGR